MQKPKKKAIGSNKNFGPIQKLTVPDFQQITNYYEQMQNEILEKPSKARRQMKQFSIHKVNKPSMGIRSKYGSATVADEVADVSKGGVEGGEGTTGGNNRNGEEQPSLLSVEEQEALQPKEVKVVNPWIHEATHKEYLENVKGLPARHANVIKQHKNIIREKTFLDEVDQTSQKDQATQEGLKILDKEYDIFNDPNLPNTKTLTRYDTWDEDRTIEQWIEYCQSRPGQPHALSPTYEGKEYVWRPVTVLDYDYKEKKFKVIVFNTGQEKLVTRLSLLFFDEDPDLFRKRVNQCKERQAIVEAELRFTNLIDSIPSDQVSALSKERRYNFLSKCVRESDKFDPEKVYATFKHLMRVVEEEYIRQMKKCIVLKEMQDPEKHQKFSKLKIPIRLPKRTAPYFGVVIFPKFASQLGIEPEKAQSFNFDYQSNYNSIEKTHWSSDDKLVGMTKIFTQKCIDFLQYRYMNTNKTILKLPRELKELKKMEASHHQSVSQNIQINWRDFLIGEIQDKLREKYDFFESNINTYVQSPLKRIIARFEYILNTFLREFVRISIQDWVGFLKSFTVPKYEKGELWKVQNTPLLVLHLSFNMKEEKKKNDKDKNKRKRDEDKDKPVELNTIEYSPGLAKIKEFLHSGLQMIIASTNKVFNLEDDLMPFIFKEQEKKEQEKIVEKGGKKDDKKEDDKKEKAKTPNFVLNNNFDWIKEANQQIEQIYEDNIVGPLQLLERFKKYEYILNVDKNALVKELFKTDEKAPLSRLKEEIQHYDKAQFDILNLSNDIEDSPLFRVMALNMKQNLSKQAYKIKDKLLQAVYKYCNQTVISIHQSYENMSKLILTEPTNEKELVQTRDYIKNAPSKVESLSNLLHDTYKHFLLLEDFSFKYNDQDIELYWIQKQWPYEIMVAITEGSYQIQNKEVIFLAKLEQEKENFAKSIELYKEDFTKIKKFNDLRTVNEYSSDAFALNENLCLAAEKVRQFNEREGLFSQSRTDYPDLEELKTQFTPFYELTCIVYEFDYNHKEWTKNPIMKQEYSTINSSVNQWYQACFGLFKKLNDDYPDAANVAQEQRQKIEQFMEHLPLIKCFTSEAIMDEDWKEIQEVVKMQNLERDDLTVEKMKENQLNRYIEEIEEITMKAEKKFNLNKKLKLMKEEMKAFALTAFPYKGKTYVLKAYDDVNAKLDDQIVSTQAMLGSQFMKGKLRVETKNWETKLNNMSELVEEIAKCQRTWMYLEPIFASDDIHKQMPTEGALFKDVDTLWKGTMDAIVSDPGIMELIERENIKLQFEDANKKLDKIQKSLSEYLEEKRLVFPRFYFLANEDLLMILAQTKDPRAVQPHMDKCFEGIQRIMFSDKEEVYGMISAEGENVLFDDKVDVNAGEKKGNVEKWMLEIESVMRRSLKKICKESMLKYKSAVRTEWVRQYPGQIVLASNQIHWTAEVEQAIKDYNNDGPETYKQILQSQIEDIVKLVRSDLNTQERITLKALVVIDVHARDVVQDLIAKDVKSIFEFDWVAQLRYYWEENDTLRVKMVTAVIDYGYEYLGNSLRLVITPLTDRCYRTLLGAKYLHYGGAPEGPAGTGKTESVKDLAKAIAVQCVVFNCSDGLDYLAMAKFFKGLAASGAWCCFDEFNRIDLEVLSVIAQQILTIQIAVKNLKQRKFIFEGTELNLNRACAVNITMNPGYAGRSELPDNLKALFRPCAMMVPDYKLIAEIELYSFGFSEASNLAVKVVASLRLSSELLSSQDHYDFGMRALKAILTACGNLRRKLDWPESFIGLRALNDVNLPKFTSNDIPLFQGITSDLFPGVELPKPDYGKLVDAMTTACKDKNLQPKREFLDKCIQLYETIMVRHGLMVVGKAFSGKSRVIQTLQRAMSIIKDDPNFVNVLGYYINPKSILQEQLYGKFDLDTQEWSDGVLAIRIRDCAESETPDRKWIIFDGPVDAVWIENMNTVLDDNKKLCLNSGQIIKLKPTMTMMFEVEDLSQASPATVSRCGMVLLEPKQLGHTPLIQSYCADLEKFIGKPAEVIKNLMNYIADTSIAFTSAYGKFPVPTDPNFLINSMINMFDCFVREWKLEDAKIPPRECEEICINALIFAFIWSVGASLDETTRPKFDVFYQEILAGENVNEKYKLDLHLPGDIKKVPVKMGDFKSVFDLFFEKDKINWLNWLKTIPPYVVPKDVAYSQLIVPTVDSIRMNMLLKILVLNDKHPMICGPTGTGKSISIANELKNSFDNNDYTYIGMSFSAQTSANQTQRIIDGKMEKRRKGVYGPPLGKKGVIFVDDLNMPQKEIFGAQPPIELLRQWMDYGGWYEIDTNEKEFRHIQQIRFVTAMGPPGGGRNSITSRYIRHFNVIYIEPYAQESLNYIFSNVMEWFFLKNTNPSFSKAIQGMKDGLVATTIIIYKTISERFRPTPAKSHYTYNLRDVSKVFQGIAKATPKAIRNENDMIKLWAHECLRVFADRLINDEDRVKFDILLKDVVQEKFKKTWKSIVEVEPLLFASFVPLVFPDGDTTKKPISDLYCELYDRQKVKDTTESALGDYNRMHHSGKMNLVLFVSAIEHIVKIHRVITTEYGNALLVGVGGSGRKSLTALATFIASYEVFSIELSKNYDFNAWRDDMKTKLFMGCGVDQKQTVFLFSDTQISNEAFVEDINNILNNGEIPNLYVAAEDQMIVIEGMREVNKNAPAYKNYTEQEIMVDFIQKAKTNLHCVLAMSPIGEDFKRRLRMFPSLVNCCTIDWFLPWPQEALQSVAEYFLNDVELENREGIVSICVDMQERVSQLTQRYYQELKRYYYVTPTSYLVLIKTFKNLLSQKRKAVNTIIGKYEKGLDQLATASEEVNRLSIQLAELIPQLQIKQKQTASMMQDIEKQKKQVAEKTKEVEAEENIAKAKKEEADTIQKDCEEELSKVMPIYNAAMKAVNDLDKNDITEIRGFKKPPDGAILVMKTLCIMFNVPPEKVKSTNVKEVVWDYWEPSKKKLLGPDLLKRLQQYDKDAVQSDIVEKLKPLIAENNYQDDVLKNVSKAAWGLAKWVRAIVQYDEAMKVVRPKQQQLKEAQEASKDAQKIWDEALDRLRAVEAQMKKLMDEFETTKAEEDRLKFQKDDCERKHQRANQLITKLAGEKVSWQQALIDNKQSRENLLGDILVSSGIIAYLGVFIQQYRKDCITNWIDMIKKFDIKSNKDVSLNSILGNQVRIREWLIQRLPQDDFSIDNAIILENSERWPLMIDPQMQANIWIKKMEEKNQIRTIKPTMDNKLISRILETQINLGYPVLLEDANDSFDPMLEPLLGKQIEKKGSIMYIRIGDAPIEYSSDFRFYVTTKLSRPHYSPEVCVKVTMLNFMVTQDGLQDQMLSIVVKHEEPQKYEKRNQCIIQKADNEKKVAELQDKILNQIANSTGDILEDDELIQTLDASKAQCISIENQLKEMQQIMNGIEIIRDHFVPVAERVSRLFFVLADLMNVDPMYQYSLKFFCMIYERALDKAEGVLDKGDRNKRRSFFIEKFTKLLYKNVCRSLFEKDKLLFSFLLCLKIMEEKNELDPIEARFLMTGATSIDFDRPNPTGERGWLSDKAWASIIEMSKFLPAFNGFDKDFEKHIHDWERIYNSSKPHSTKETWPGTWNELTQLRRVLVLRIIRPDKVISAIQQLIRKEQELGKAYISPPSFNLAKSFSDSTNKTPVIFVLSPGADPMSELQKLAEQKKIRWKSLSLGQGQAQKAKEAILFAQEAQEWVVLQNCHLAPSFMPILDGIIEDINEEKTSLFRIWLTSMPSDKFPVSILQNGVKVTNEPPKGLKNNILGSYLGIDESEFESSPKPNALKRLMWGLCFFNALIIERRKYGPLGWNIPYEFSASDLRISQAQLYDFLKHYDDVPYDALRYMVAEANYGGRVTDPMDRRSISIILQDYYNSDMLKEGHKFSESGKYFVPPDGSLANYIDFIRNQMPVTDLTEVFGLHENADITSAINDTNQLLGTALSLMPRKAAGAGKTQEEVLQDLAKHILDKLPKDFDIDEAAKKHPIMYEESMNTVLQQELLRFNKLLQEVRTSLVNIGKAIKGEIVMSLELEALSNSLFDNLVPNLWAKKAYPSLKPLASWVNDFIQRLKFMQEWVDHGAPPTFWISGFFFTQSFLTGVKQNYARKHIIAIDQIDFDFQIISDPSKFDLTKPPEDGCYNYGLYLEGCRWNSEQEVLAESFPKQLFTQMQQIWLRPKKVSEIDFGHSYQCPVYKTSRRAGTLSTTGHSTNFVLHIWLPMQKKHDQKHWVKRGVALLTQLND